MTDKYVVVPRPTAQVKDLRLQADALEECGFFMAAAQMRALAYAMVEADAQGKAQAEIDADREAQAARYRVAEVRALRNEAQERSCGFARADKEES